MSDKEVATALKVSEGSQSAYEKAKELIGKPDKEGNLNSLTADKAGALMPDDLSVDVFHRSLSALSDINSGTMRSVQEAAIDAFKSNKDLHIVNATVDLGGGTKINHRIERERNFPNMRDPDGPAITNYAHVTTKITTEAASGNGDYKKIRDWHKGVALEAIGKTPSK